MKKILSFLTLLTVVAGFSAKAYNCPENLYFYVSEATTSTAFTKAQNVFTYTVDATESQSDIYGVIVNYNATSWGDAQSHNGYFANGKSGDITVSGSEEWTTVNEWVGSANNRWSNGCYKFVKGKEYIITLTYANGAFTGSVTVDGETPVLPVAKEFDTTKDYYIDASACSWFFDGGALIKVWDGAENVLCEKVSGSVLKFRPTAKGDNGMVYLKRVNPDNEGQTWNEYGVSAPDDAALNMFVINSGFSGGEWKTYSTPEAWVISKNINNWSADAKSEYVFAYDEATGIYTVSVPADKLRVADDAENDGFKIGYGALNDWDNYYGAVIANKVMADNVAADAVKNGQNFLIPAAATTPVTLTFNPKEGKITADWEVTPVGPDDPINPEDTDDVLKVNLPKMDINGSTTVEVTLQAAQDKDYCTAQWDIVVPAGFTVSDIALNKERCTDHELITNVVDGVTKCIVYSANNTPFVRASRPLFSFTLTADNAAVGDVEGSLSNILFSIPPKDGNLNISSRFADTPLNISVVKAVRKLTADPANLALSTGESNAVTINVEPADASDKTVTWEIISGENVIELAEGNVTAKASGVATIKVTANDGFGASVTIDVTVDGKKVENITLSATEHTMYVGETTTLTATVTPDDATNKGVMWVSSDDNVATVDENGLVTAVSAGEAIIHAVAKDGSGVEATCTMTIKAKVSGDADGDDQLTIADIVIIAKKVVGIETEGAKLENMDMDGDGTITSTDVTLAVYYLNQQTVADLPSQAQMSSNMLTLTTPVAMSDNLLNIPLYLQGASGVAGIQFDIVLPEGLELAEDSYVAPEASNGHSISTAALGDNTYRVVIYSAYNFESNALGYISVRNTAELTGKADFDLNNVMYSDGSNLLATDDSRTTLDIFSGVDSIFGDADARYDVYTTAGILVLTQADKATVNALPAGIYVVGNRKVMVR